MKPSIHPEVLRQQAELLRAWSAQWGAEAEVPGSDGIARHLSTAAKMVDEVLAGRRPVGVVELPRLAEVTDLREG